MSGYKTNVWGRIQSVEGIRGDLAAAESTGKDVMDSQTAKVMPSAEFVEKTRKVLA